MDEGQRKAIIFAGRKRVLVTIVLPVMVVLLAILLFGVWRLGVSNSEEAVVENEDTLARVQPVTIITLEELLSLPSPDIRISESNQVIINGSLRANKAFILTPGKASANPETGELYYDASTNEFRYYDGSAFVSVASQDPDKVICYIGDDCGFLRVGDLPSGITLPQALGVTDSPTFAGLTLTNDLSVSQGGTGRSSLPANSLLVGNGNSSLASTNTPIAGQILVANSIGVPGFLTLSGDVAISASGSASINANTVDSSEIVASGVTAGVYGDGANYPIFTVDVDGRITSSSTLALPGGGGGVGSLNTLTGALTIQGTTNQVSVTSGGSTITLATPQDIAMTSSPTFNGLSVSSLTIASDTISDFTGTGLQVSGGALSLVNDFGSSIDSSEITDSTVADRPRCN